MDLNLAESDDDQREERIVNRPGQMRNQPSNIRRKGDRNRSRGGEQTRRRVEIRRRTKVRNQDDNLWGGSNSRRRGPILGSSQPVQMVQWDRSDSRLNYLFDLFINVEGEWVGGHWIIA